MQYYPEYEANKWSYDYEELKPMIKIIGETGSLEDHKKSGRHEKSVIIAQVVKEDADRHSTSSAHGECKTRTNARLIGISFKSVWQSLGILLKRYQY